MEKDLASAVLKLAEVHDRRMGEIAVQLGRLADAFHSTPVGAAEMHPIERLAHALER